MPEVQVRGLRIHVERLGQGDRTVVFLHGLVLDNLSSFYFTLAPAVAAFSEVILYDLRGHGKSERPLSGYSVAEMVADLVVLLDELGVERPVYLVAHSFGGLVAMTFASSYPARVAGMVLLEPLVGEDGWGDQMAYTLTLEGEERDQQIAKAFGSWLERHSNKKRNLLGRIADDMLNLVHNTSLVEDLRSSPALAPAELAGIHCPMLVLFGENSDVRETGKQVLGSLPGCEFRLIPGCTHSVLWEATAEVRQQIVEWLSKGR
jgi:pimeloyl-ACP methyl ester carboxylesterase